MSSLPCPVIIDPSNDPSIRAFKSCRSSQSLVDPAEDPKQALPSAAARHAHWASILEQSGAEKDMSGDPEEVRLTVPFCVIHFFFNEIISVLCVFSSHLFWTSSSLDVPAGRGHTGGRSHRISHPPSFCGACLYFSREKDSAVPFHRRP